MPDIIVGAHHDYDAGVVGASETQHVSEMQHFFTANFVDA
jgi:hypothetical protein